MDTEEQTNSRFAFSLPFDPLRVILALRRYWLLIIVFPLFGLFIGWALGYIVSPRHYVASLPLLRVEPPNIIKASLQGEAFKPRHLSDATLLATATAAPVLEKTGQKIDPTLSAGQVRSLTEISKKYESNLFILTARSSSSAQNAVDLVNAWGEEITTYSRELQKAEAEEIAQYISHQRQNLDKQIREINQAILTFVQENEFIDENSQVISNLASIEENERKLADAKIALEAKKGQIKRYVEEIKFQSPIIEQIKEKKEELIFLRGRYTDENPIVKEKLYEIDFLQKQFDDIEVKSEEDLKQFTGTALGDNLYLEILALRTEQSKLENQVTELNKILKERKANIQELPEKQLTLTELKQKRQELLTSYTLASNRSLEAEFFTQSPPGYLKVFQDPSLSGVPQRKSGFTTKLLQLLGLLGGMSFAGLFALYREYSRPEVGTPLQAAILSQSPVELLVHTNSSEALRTSLHEFWLGSLAQLPPGKRRIFFPIVGQCEGEEQFWKTLFEQIRAEGVQAHLLDLSEKPLGIKLDGNALPTYSSETKPPLSTLHLSDSALLEKHLQTLPDDLYVLARLEGEPKSNLLSILRRFSPYYPLQTPTASMQTAAASLARIYQKVLGAAQGLILVETGGGPKVRGLVENAGVRLSRWPSSTTSESSPS